MNTEVGVYVKQKEDVFLLKESHERPDRALTNYQIIIERTSNNVLMLRKIVLIILKTKVSNYFSI